MRRTAVILGLLFLFDLGYAGQGIFSILVAAGGLLLLSVGAIWSAARREAPRARSRALRASLYLVLGIAAYFTATVHRVTAERRADRVIEACRAFEARRGGLPARLDELVPEFLPAVPKAKLTLAYNTFSYSSFDAGSHTLMYTTLPPFGRRTYHFESRRWSLSD